MKLFQITFSNQRDLLKVNLHILFIGLLLCSACTKEKKCLQKGDQCPDFTPMEWLQSPTNFRKAPKSKVTMIRWWTDDCWFCINSSPALNEWYHKYRNQGLQILGIYHPKPIERKPSTEEIREFIQEKEFQFPIGIDINWDNLEKFWLNCGHKEFTSVSFIVDSKGTIRYIHPGGEYHKEIIEGHENCVRDYNEVDSVIQKILTE